MYQDASPLKNKAFRDIAREESKIVIKDNKMCSFYLLHSMEDIFNAKMINMQRVAHLLAL